MEVLYISILCGILTFFICNIIESLIFGDRGRDNQISNYYKYIKGSYKVEKKNKGKLIFRKNINGKLSKKSNVVYAIVICIAIFIVMYLLSKSIGLAFVISLLGLTYPKILLNKRIKKKKDLVNIQFRDALNSIVSSLKAGLSINSALIKCSDDLERLYTLLKDKPMLDEFIKIKNDLNMGMAVDDALRNFMKRMNMEDVEDFANSVIIVRQKGGNLVEVMENVSKMITDKIQMKREIDTLTASKKLEAKIMTIVPIIIIISLSIFSRSYVEPLYESVMGKVFIAIAFIFLVINYFVANKIVSIDV